MCIRDSQSAPETDFHRFLMNSGRPEPQFCCAGAVDSAFSSKNDFCAPGVDYGLILVASSLHLELLGAPFGSLGRLWRVPGHSLVASGDSLGALLALLGRFLGALGCSRGTSGHPWGPRALPETILVRFWVDFRRFFDPTPDPLPATEVCFALGPRHVRLKCALRCAPDRCD